MMANGQIKDAFDIHNQHGVESLANFKIMKDTSIMGSRNNTSTWTQDLNITKMQK